MCVLRGALEILYKYSIHTHHRLVRQHSTEAQNEKPELFQSQRSQSAAQTKTKQKNYRRN